MLLAVIWGVVGVSLGLLPASWNLKLAKVFVSWGIRWDFCSGYWDYWYVKTMHTSVSPIDTNTDGPWNMYLRLQNISSFWVCSTSGGGTHNRQKPSKNWSHVMGFTPGIWIIKHLRDRLRTARAHFDGVRGTLEESWSGLGTSIGCVQDKTDLSTNHEYDVLIYLEAYYRIIVHIFLIQVFSSTKLQRFFFIHLCRATHSLHSWCHEISGSQKLTLTSRLRNIIPSKHPDISQVFCASRLGHDPLVCSSVCFFFPPLILWKILGPKSPGMFGLLADDSRGWIANEETGKRSALDLPSFLGSVNDWSWRGPTNSNWVGSERNSRFGFTMIFRLQPWADVCFLVHFRMFPHFLTTTLRLEHQFETPKNWDTNPISWLHMILLIFFWCSFFKCWYRMQFLWRIMCGVSA